MSDQNQLLSQAQLYQQQIQGITMQKENLNMQLSEIKNALSELEKTTEKDVYKISGTILIKSSKSSVKKDLEEKKELISVKMQTLEKSEKKLMDKIEDLRSKLKKG